MSTPNPLVAQAPAEPDGFFNKGTGDNGWMTGFSLGESAMDAYKGISEGNWVEGGLGMVGLVADAASMAIDPIGTLMSSAASFLMEHVQPLKEALDWLAGDPPVIESYSTTWKNVSQELGKVAAEYKAAVDATSPWTGPAADAYRGAAGGQLDALSGAASTAGSVGTVVGIMGMVVGFVREMVRDLIADLVAKLITWVLEAVFTLGFGTPVIVAQAVTAISKWATRIGELIQKLIKTIKKVSPMLGKLVEIFTKIMKVVGKLVGKVTGLDVISTKSIKPGGLFHSTNSPDLSPSGGSPSTPSSSSTPDSSPSSPSSPDSSPSSPSSPSPSSSPSSTPDGPSRTPDSSSPSSAPTPSRTPDSSSTPDTPSPSRTPDSSPDAPSPSRTPDNASSPSRTPDSSPGSPSSPAGPGAPHSGPSSTPDAPPPPRNTGQTVQSSVAAPEAPTRADVPPAPTPPRTPDSSPPSQSGPMGGSPAAPAGGGAPSSPAAGRPSPGGQGWTGTPGSRGDLGSGAPSAPRSPDLSTSASRADAPPRPPSMPSTPSAPSSPSMPSAPHSPSAPSAPSGGMPHAPSAGAPHAPSAGAPHAPSTGAPHAPSAGAPHAGGPSAGGPNAGRPDSTPPSRATAPSAAAPHAPSAPSTPNMPPAGPPHAPSMPPAGAPHAPSAGAPHAPRPDAPMRPQSSAPSAPNAPHSPNSPSAPSARTDVPNAPSSRPDAPHNGPGTTMPSSRPDAPHAPNTPHHGPNAPHGGPNAPHGGPNAPASRPDGPHGGPNSPSRPDAPNRPDSPSRPDGNGPGNRPDGTRPDGSRPHSPDGARSRGTDTVDAPPHRSPDADAPHHGPGADKPHDTTPDKPHDGDSPNDPNNHDPDAPSADRPSPDEAHQRHAETTPAGVSHHGGDPNMGDLPHKVPNDPRYFTADVHVTPDGKARIGGHDYTPAEYADMLRKSGYDGSKPVRLIGCDAASNDFARQLSKHLDAPVLAPTKPAWTDANGRVFTSDPEIRPDGTRQPKIPPNGEWETHHPDGTKTKTGDDGFAPGTHDKDVDPSDAKDRAGRPISNEDVPGIEKQDPILSMEDKVKNEKYREKYYDGPNEDGSYRRKNASQKDADGQDVPILTRDKDGEIQPKSMDYTGMDYRKDIPDDGPRKATPEQAERAQDLIDRRAEANRTANEVEAKYQKAKEDSTLTDELAQERKDAHRDRTDRGEDLGEHAAGDSMADMYRDSDLTPHQVPTKDTGAGTFDQVYEIKDKDGNTVKWAIVEAKGPNADLGVRKGLDGQNYEQGHPKYLESVLQNMRDRGDGDLADKLEAAALGGDLDYTVVKAKVSHETVDVTQPDGSVTQTKEPRYGGYDRRHFDISGYGS